MGRGRELFAWALLVLFGVALGFGTIEVGVRALHLVPDRFWRADADLGWRHTPGESGWWTQEDREFTIPIHINAHGLRDVDHGYEKPIGVERVMLLGDSFIEALQVPLADTITRRLQAALGQHVEVIGTGVSGYGTASELLFLRREGLRYDPDVVVLGFYPGNDVKNNSPTLEDTLRPVYDSHGRLLRVEQPAGLRGGLSQEGKGWRAHWQSYQYIRQLILRHPGLAGPLHRLGLMRATGPRTAPERDGIPVDYWVFAPQPDGEWQLAWARTEGLLDEMRATLAEAHKHFIVMLIPTRYEVYPDSWQQTIAVYPAMRNRTWDPTAPRERMLAWCQAHAVSCLDLYPAFRAAAGGAAPLYFQHDGHWTATGHAVAAKGLAEFLLQQRLVPTSQKEKDR